MKDFFAKHRHLIVIALILAVILAALTPLLVPLGLELEEKIDLPELKLQIRLPVQKFDQLKADEIRYYTVSCGETLHNYSSLSRLLRYTQWDDPAEIAALCTLLNEAPKERNSQRLSGEVLCEFRLEETDESSLSQKYSLCRTGDRYFLSGLGRLGGEASWFIDDETAETLLTYCYCSDDWIHEHPSTALCREDNIQSASLLTWTDREKAPIVELSQEQITTLCAFLEEHFLTARNTKGSQPPLPHGENGWQLALYTRANQIWYIQYNDSQNCLSLYCQTATQTTRYASGYQYTDEAAVIALPELILAAGQ